MDVVIYRPLLAAFLLLTHQQVAALPVLLEVYYDAPGSDAGGVFTEIAGGAGFSLTGYSLVGINGGTGNIYRNITLDGAIVPSDGILVLATSSASGDTLAARDWVANVDWQNGPDAVALLDPAGMVVDALQYGILGTFAAGEGTPAEDAGPGSSLSRNITATDSGDNALDFSLGAPTPGSGFTLPAAPPPRTAVAEPASIWLALVMLATLIGARRPASMPQCRSAVRRVSNGGRSCQENPGSGLLGNAECATSPAWARAAARATT